MMRVRTMAFQAAFIAYLVSGGFLYASGKVSSEIAAGLLALIPAGIVFYVVKTWEDKRRISANENIYADLWPRMQQLLSEVITIDTILDERTIADNFRRSFTGGSKPSKGGV